MLGNILAPSPGDLRLTHGTPVKLPPFISNHPCKSRYVPESSSDINIYIDDSNAKDVPK